MPPYGPEILAAAVINLVAIVSPGPDFALILRQSLVYGRRTALWSSLGVGTGIFFHIGYSLLGIGWLIQNSDWAFSTLKWLGVGYLTWLAWQGLRARPAVVPTLEVAAPAPSPSLRQAFTTGLLTNVLNPKATLFFVALFSTAIHPHTPRWVQVAFGVWSAVATAAWFGFVSLAFTRPEVHRRFRRYSHWIDRAMGVALLGFALSLARARLG